MYICENKRKQSNIKKMKKQDPTKKAGSSYYLSTDTTDNPKLGAKVLANGNQSLWIEFYLGYDRETTKKSRTREFLKLYLIGTPKTPVERQQNKETIELAKKIRFEREQQLKNEVEGYRLKKDKKINFLDYFQMYLNEYTKKDIKMIELALSRFKDFLKDTPQYSMFANDIKPQQINRDMILRFVEYLQKRSYGEGANSIYARFKKVVNYAIDHDIMVKNPCKGIVIKVDEKALKKDILTFEEIQLLANTHYDNESNDIRRAFLFCCFSGLRFVDVHSLTFGNVDFTSNILKFDQKKTSGHSSNSWVTMKLTPTLLQLIGEPPTDTITPNNATIFNLKTYESCTKALRRWVKRAGIKKAISWHCARHSFGTNLAMQGNSPFVIKELMGHSSLKYTERYVRAVEEQKANALNNMPTLII
jgi:Site-specific recombinase XerD